MAWNLILLKNVMPRETQKILSLTMVSIYHWLLVLPFLIWIFWKLCILCSSFLLRRSISKWGRWRSSWRRWGQFGPICFWYTRTKSIPWEWRGGGRGTHPCWSWRRLGPDYIQPHSKRKTSTDGCLPCHQTGCIWRRVRACRGHTKQEPCFASSGPEVTLGWPLAILGYRFFKLGCSHILGGSQSVQQWTRSVKVECGVGGASVSANFCFISICFWKVLLLPYIYL